MLVICVFVIGVMTREREGVGERERQRDRENGKEPLYLLLEELMNIGISLLKGKDLLLFPTLNSAISVYIKVRI